MCGINGIFSSAKVELIGKRIRCMNDALIHRGPDAGATKLFNESIALGHRRLSVIDVSILANQPMMSNNGRYFLIFNGEIYNFAEIKKLLPNYLYQTHSDSEVILAAVETFGLDWFLTRANGMFAIGLLDLHQRQLFLVRDRFGVKPLYYTVQKDMIIFSSEIKGILASGLVEASLNLTAIDDYLGYRYVREPYSFFENIYQLPSAHYMIIDANLKYQVVKYWELPKEFNTCKNYNESEILAKFKEKFTHAVNLRLIADVPVGSYLSGGVDSSLISAMVATSQLNFNTYSIGFNESNEFEFSRRVAKQYETNHHEVELTNKIYLDLDNWRWLISCKDAPLGVPNEIPLAILSKELKKDITVVLSGEGADELMGGYGRIYRLGFEYENSKYSHNQSFYEYFSQKYEYINRDTRDFYLNTNENYRKYFDDEIQRQYNNGSYDEFVFRFFHTYHVKGLLQRLDATTMCYSVEGRVPFLDYELVEFVYKEVPYELKLKWNSFNAKIKAQDLQVEQISEKLDTPKYLIKKLAEQYLSKDLVYRKKVGFPVPLSDWYQDIAGIATHVLKNATWLKPDSYLQLIEQLKSAPRAGQMLWMFINIEIFISQYFSKSYRW